MLNLSQIQNKVSEWSEKNFGKNRTPYLKVDKKSNHPELGSLAALMGIGEEVGELFEGGTKNDIKDAIGDILIYLCDYASRENFVLPYGPTSIHIPPHMVDEEPGAGIVIHVGKLFHCTLKRHQGIRGFEDDSVYVSFRNKHVALLLAYLDKYIRSTFDGSNLLMVVNETWNKIVSKRNWKTQPDHGGLHDHKTSQ